MGDIRIYLYAYIHIEKAVIVDVKNKYVPFCDQSFKNPRSLAQYRTRIGTGPKNDYMGGPVINS